MAGETIRTEAVCLDIRPWSKTSHVVAWLTPTGKVTTVVKGAERPKSYLLGQYDLNYTCEILYYARAQGEVHALRDCVPLAMREELRGDYRKLALAGYFRWLVREFAPQGRECAKWYELLATALEGMEATVPALLRFELKVLDLLGLRPEIESAEEGFVLRGERRIPVSAEVADYLRDPTRPIKNSTTPLDTARVIGVFYHFHLDSAPDVRRTVLGMISKN